MRDDATPFLSGRGLLTRRNGYPTGPRPTVRDPRASVRAGVLRIYAGDRRHGSVCLTSTTATIPKRLRHRDTPLDIAQLYVVTVGRSGRVSSRREESKKKVHSGEFYLYMGPSESFGHCGHVCHSIGGAFRNTWKKRRPGAAVSMTHRESTHTATAARARNRELRALYGTAGRCVSVRRRCRPQSWRRGARRRYRQSSFVVAVSGGRWRRTWYPVGRASSRVAPDRLTTETNCSMRSSVCVCVSQQRFPTVDAISAGSTPRLYFNYKSPSERRLVITAPCPETKP